MPPKPTDKTADVDIPTAVYPNWRPSVERRPIKRELTESEHTALVHRATEIEESLLPHAEQERAKVEGIVLTMLFSFRQTAALPREQAKATVGLILPLLTPFPVWAIERACLMFMNGDAMRWLNRYDSNFAPNNSQVIELVRNVKAREQLKAINARNILSARIDTEERTVVPAHRKSPCPTSLPTSPTTTEPAGVGQTATGHQVVYEPDGSAVTAHTGNQ